jgi:tetratricopeptide (TPR) repeat protein
MRQFASAYHFWWVSATAQILVLILFHICYSALPLSPSALSIRLFSQPWLVTIRLVTEIESYDLICVRFSVILTALEDFRNARAAYERALKLNPELLISRLNFSIFEYRRGNVVDAVRAIGPAIADPTSTNGSEVGFLKFD